MENDETREYLLEGSDEGMDSIWETFHENSKLTPFSKGISLERLKEKISNFAQVLPYNGYPAISLERTNLPSEFTLKNAIDSRASIRSLKAIPLSLETISTFLLYAYGVNRHSFTSANGRSFRSAPSAGALYPLEIYFYSVGSTELPEGIYHFNPILRIIRQIEKGDRKNELKQLVVQPEIILGASMVIFITAVFERLTLKYQDRGYRYALLESGHVAQNFNLIATALGLGSVNIGGFYDRKIDEFLDLDGLTHSTIYMLAIGGILHS